MMCSVRKFVALLMLVVVTTNVFVWDSSSTRMAHQISHISQLDLGAGNHSHPCLDAAHSLGKCSVLHQVLHAVDHLQYFANLAAHAAIELQSAGLGRIAFPERGYALATLEPPYRPPSEQAARA
ncbi:hypothetical protein NX774_00145 [Massilia agilis]|uniref:Uncharacterized protein n=1 Tax=Massilia agilis TaxID=1811226 RepID=A0ABT2D4V0_9BURK|nr:hypothetical protein [Massilia agilis]MCS0806335.1 hypothetical protein [Massilia agilis]